MIFHPTGLSGAVLIALEPINDERGSFARSFCRREFAAQGLPVDFVQQSLSFNASSGTLRGMHYQAAPDAEAKLIRCTRGAIHDVIIDVRPGSPSFLAARAFTLSAENGLSLFIPGGIAHGFLTLADATEILYQMTDFHRPEIESGFRWDDKAFALSWPHAVKHVSARDRNWPDFTTP